MSNSHSGNYKGGKTFSTLTEDIFLGEYMEKFKEVSNTIHPPSWEHEFKK